ITGENTNLAVRVDQRSFSYVRQVMTRHSVRHATWVGRLQPLKGTANGAVLLGNVPPAGYVATRKTIEPDITAIAAPLYAPGGQIIASLSITAPTYRITDHKLTQFARLLVDGASRVSQLLNGGRPPRQLRQANRTTLRQTI